MAAPITPAGVNVQGKVKTVFSPTGSLTAPSVATFTGTSALDVSNILYADGWSYTREQAKNPAPRRLGTKRVWEIDGSISESLGDLRYTVDPQGAAGSDGKKAYEKFPEGTTGYFLMRKGLDVDTDLAAGQLVEVIPVKLLARHITGDPADEAAEFTVVQGILVSAPGKGDLVAMVI
jgi:hypothetical protein